MTINDKSKGTGSILEKTLREFRDTHVQGEITADFAHMEEAINVTQ